MSRYCFIAGLTLRDGAPAPADAPSAADGAVWGAPAARRMPAATLRELRRMAWEIDMGAEGRSDCPQVADGPSRRSAEAESTLTLETRKY